MKIKQQLFLAIATLVFLTSILVSCNSEPPLRVGLNIWPGFQSLYLAQDLGYYKNAGIKLVDYPSASEAMRAYRNRDIEAVTLTLDEALLLAETTPNFRVVLITDRSNGADVILAKPPIQKLKDLKGKTVGVESGALGAFVLTRALLKEGISTKDVKIVSLGISEHEQAFKKGIIDAVVTYEPTSSKLLETGAKLVFDSTAIPGEIVDIIIMSEERLNKDLNSSKVLVNGWFNALNYLQKNPQDAANRIAPRASVTPKEFLKSLKGLILPDLQENQRILGKKDASSALKLKQLAKFLFDNKLLTKEIDPNSLFDDRLVKNVTLSP